MRVGRRVGEAWGITPDLWPVDVTYLRTLNALSRGVDRVILRERRLPWERQFSLLKRILDAGIEGKRVLLRVDEHAPLGRASRLGCGLHLADTQWTQLPSVSYCSRAVHRTETLRLIRTPIDAVVVSPVFPPRSKPSAAPPLGASGLREMIGQASVPLIALGGITAPRARECLHAGAAGVAGISAVFAEDPTELDALLHACHTPSPLG